MAHYRLYTLDSGGRIARAFDLACPDDEGAVAEATSLHPGESIELWCGSRVVWKTSSHGGDGPPVILPTTNN